MAIFMANARFYIPLEAGMSIMNMVMTQACAGCPISVGGEPPDPVIMLGGIGQDFEITEALTFGDLGVDDTDAVELNTEAGPGYCDGHLEGPSVDPETGFPTIYIDQHAITDTVAMTYFGAAIWADFGAGNVLLGVAKFPVPLGTGTPGDIFKIGGPWSLCSCVPATEE